MVAKLNRTSEHLLMHGLRTTVFQLYRWSTHWFQLFIDIPEEWRGDEVHLRWNSGSEAMVHNIFSCASISRHVSCGSCYQFWNKVFSKSGSHIGSITSHCSGKEPALLPRTHGWTHGRSIVNFDQWKICLPESSRLHKLSFSQ